MIAAKPSRLRLDSASREAMVRFLTHPRYEVLPTEEAGDLVAAGVPTEVTITVTSSPRRGIEATLALAERLSARGYHVVPHLAARLVRDASHLKDILTRIDAIGGRVFVVAGDSQEAAGQFPDSVSLLEAIATHSPAMKEIGVTGYPERHSFIDDDLTIQAMWDKRRQATYIVSNLCFDVRVVKKWVARVRKRGVALPIHVGMAGVADPAKLLRVSTRIGLGDSARFLRGHSNWLLRMIQPGGYAPERFAASLMPELARPEMKVAGIHVFTFNEIGPTEQWRQQMLARLH
ncbi:MAG TPA: methylenetetrahydrofolate reductase [Candidatus Dormibacteraeota bacterium]|nr:methylenetetrahydrofolate reductase [Candidatus Dormibacteraeota bacterium]